MAFRKLGVGKEGKSGINKNRKVKTLCCIDNFCDDGRSDSKYSNAPRKQCRCGNLKVSLEFYESLETQNSIKKVKEDIAAGRFKDYEDAEQLIKDLHA